MRPYDILSLLGWTWIEHFVFMASSTPATPSTKETTNYARLCRVLVDVGTCALRDCFDSICTPPTLHTVLAANQPTLQSLRSKRIINATQWGKLFPAIPASVSSRDFDITLLMILLRNICGLAPPLTGWDALPGSTDVSREADIARVKYLRNTVYGHAEQAFVDDATFDTHWKEIRDTLVRLGGEKYKVLNRCRIVIMISVFSFFFGFVLFLFGKSEGTPMQWFMC